MAPAAGPAPEPTGPPKAPRFRYGAPTDPPAYRATSAAIAALAKAGGRLALSEAIGAVATLDGAIAAGIAAAGTDRTGDAVGRIRDALERRGVYADRATELARALGDDAVTIAGPPAIPDLAALQARARARAATRDRLAAATGRAGRALGAASKAADSAALALSDPSSFRPRAPKIINSRLAWERRLAEIGRTIRGHLSQLTGNRTRWAGDPLPHETDVDWTSLVFEAGRVPVSAVEFDGPTPELAGWWQDRALEALDAARAARESAAVELAAAEAAEASATELVSSLVCKAVEAAGGRDRVVDGLQGALLLSDPPGALADLFGQVRKLTADHAGIGQQLDRLATAGVAEGPARDDLVGRRERTMAQIVEARGRLAGDAKRHAGGIVDAALAGDEQARAQLEELARSQPRCFRRGFLASVEAAEYSRAVRSGE
jgi:hypothetical protein